MGVLVFDRGVVPAAPGDRDAVVRTPLAARRDLTVQGGRAEEESGVAVIDVVLDDLGVEHSHAHQGGVNDPIGGEGGLGAAPYADTEMRAHMEAQEGGRGRRGDEFRRPGTDRRPVPR